MNCAPKPVKLIMIDNYDSFTWNLVQYLRELEADVEVYRNDEVSVSCLESKSPDCLVISPGPCSPSEAGISVEAIKYFAGKIPILGVCLGHQAIGVAFGAQVVSAKTLMHGKVSEITTNSSDLFDGLPKNFHVARYHSLSVEKSSCPSCLKITSLSKDDNEIMSVRHKNMPIYGVQFHPESILSEHGHHILRNFLQQTVYSK